GGGLGSELPAAGDLLADRVELHQALTPSALCAHRAGRCVRGQMLSAGRSHQLIVCRPGSDGRFIASAGPVNPPDEQLWPARDRAGQATVVCSSAHHKRVAKSFSHCNEVSGAIAWTLRRSITERYSARSWGRSRYSALV